MLFHSRLPPAISSACTGDTWVMAIARARVLRLGTVRNALFLSGLIAVSSQDVIFFVISNALSLSSQGGHLPELSALSGPSDDGLAQQLRPLHLLVGQHDLC